MVDGQWLLRDGEFMTLDYAQARGELEEVCRELQLKRYGERLMA
jgi:hypothetical protein